MMKELYMHHVPGRLRVKCHLLKGDSGAAEHVKQAVETLPGVERCKVSPITGSVLCHYDASATDAEGLLDCLRHLLPDAASTEPRSRLDPPALRFLDAPPVPAAPADGRSQSLFASPLQEKITTLLLEKALERAVVLLVRAVI